MSAILTGCRTDKSGIEPVSRKSYTIQLKANREIISIEEKPLSAVRSSSDDLYGVQIWDITGGTPQPYAYGLFNDASKIELKLTEGNDYKIEMTLFPNGIQSIKPATAGYKEPFGLSSGNPKLENKFIVSSSVYMNRLGSGQVYFEDTGTTQNHPKLSRFHGVVEQFTPIGDESIDIELKWVVFGLTVIPEGLTEGKLLISLDGDPNIQITPSSPNAITKQIHTFKRANPALGDWCSDDYFEKIPMKITWVKGDLTRVVILDTDDPNPIQFKRRVEKILRIRLDESPSIGGGNSFEISKEDETLQSSESITI